MRRSYIPMVVVVLIICLSGLAVADNYIAVDYDINNIINFEDLYGKTKTLGFSGGVSLQEKWYIDGSYVMGKMTEYREGTEGPFSPMPADESITFSDMHVAGNYMLFEEQGAAFSIGLAGLYRRINQTSEDYTTNINMFGLGAKASGKIELKDGFAIVGDVLWGPSYTMKGQDSTAPESMKLGATILSFSVGAEYALMDSYLIRAGYRYTSGDIHVKDEPEDNFEHAYKTFYIGAGFNF